MIIQKLNKYWWPRLRNALILIGFFIIGFVCGQMYGTQEALAAIGTVLSFTYAVIKIIQSLFGKRKTDEVKKDV
jgi:hypothetical protein